MLDISIDGSWPVICCDEKAANLPTHLVHMPGAILRVCNDDQGRSLHWNLQNHPHHCLHADCTAQSKTRLLQQTVPACS